jgi:hypothetical protein
MIEQPLLECKVAIFDDLGLESDNVVLLFGEFENFSAKDVLESCEKKSVLANDESEALSELNLP